MTDTMTVTDTAGRANHASGTGPEAMSTGYILTLILAAVLGVFGLLFLLGGVWLILLGGSWYYAIAGIGLGLTAYFLVVPSMTALWVYLATFGFTLVWAYWEKGFDLWAQVPRLVAPTVVLVFVLLTLPVLTRHSRKETS